jgi:hypothetical protein
MAMLAMDYWSHGMEADALAWAEQAYSLAPWDVMPIGLYAGLLSRSGDATRAKKVIEKLDDGRSHVPYARGLFHVLAGEIDEATEWVQKAIQQRYIASVFQLMFSPVGKALRASDRWPAIASLLNLPEATTTTPPADH